MIDEEEAIPLRPMTQNQNNNNIPQQNINMNATNTSKGINVALFGQYGDDYNSELRRRDGQRSSMHEDDVMNDTGIVDLIYGIQNPH